MPLLRGGTPPPDESNEERPRDPLEDRDELLLERDELPPPYPRLRPDEKLARLPPLRLLLLRLGLLLRLPPPPELPPLPIGFPSLKTPPSVRGPTRMGRNHCIAIAYVVCNLSQHPQHGREHHGRILA